MFVCLFVLDAVGIQFSGRFWFWVKLSFEESSFIYLLLITLLLVMDMFMYAYIHLQEFNVTAFAVLFKIWLFWLSKGCGFANVVGTVVIQVDVWGEFIC